MRQALGKLPDGRHVFTATVERYGSKPGYKGRPDIRTILLKNITIGGRVVADHLWFTAGKSWDNMAPLVTVRFAGRVTGYAKGYRGSLAAALGEEKEEYDYKISNPTSIVKL